MVSATKPLFIHKFPREHAPDVLPEDLSIVSAIQRLMSGRVLPYSQEELQGEGSWAVSGCHKVYYNSIATILNFHLLLFSGDLGVQGSIGKQLRHHHMDNSISNVLDLYLLNQLQNEMPFPAKAGYLMRRIEVMDTLREESRSQNQLEGRINEVALAAYLEHGIDMFTLSDAYIPDLPPQYGKGLAGGQQTKTIQRSRRVLDRRWRCKQAQYHCEVHGQSGKYQQAYDFMKFCLSDPERQEKKGCDTPVCLQLKGANKLEPSSSHTSLAAATCARYLRWLCWSSTSSRTFEELNCLPKCLDSTTTSSQSSEVSSTLLKTGKKLTPVPCCCKHDNFLASKNQFALSSIFLPLGFFVGGGGVPFRTPQCREWSRRCEVSNRSLVDAAQETLKLHCCQLTSCLCKHDVSHRTKHREIVVAHCSTTEANPVVHIQKIGNMNPSS